VKTEVTKEDDIEAQLTKAEGYILRDTDEMCPQDEGPDGEDPLPSEIQYVDAARSFMSLLLDNPLSKTHVFKANPVPCGVPEDETLGLVWKVSNQSPGDMSMWLELNLPEL
jgi:hypothetical protein